MREVFSSHSLNLGVHADLLVASMIRLLLGIKGSILRPILYTILMAILVTTFVPMKIGAQDKTENSVEERLKSLERRSSSLESDLDEKTGYGGFAFICGIFCALWAQNTGRSAWLWFFLGLFFTFIAVISLLVKNADDLRSLKQKSSKSDPNDHLGHDAGDGQIN